MSLLQNLQTDYSMEIHVFVAEPTDGLFLWRAMYLSHNLQTDYSMESCVFVTEPTDGLFYGEPCICHITYTQTILWRAMSFLQNLQMDYSI